MNLYTAFLFLTRIPLPQIKFNENKIAGSVVFFPIVGTFLGIVLWALYKILSQFFSIQVTCIFILTAYLMLTGGMHTDGFADTLDGFFCGGEKQKKLEVMKDSLIGAFGTIGIVVLLLLKWSLLYSLNTKYMFHALLVFPTVSRWLMTIAIVYFPYIRPKGLGEAFRACRDYDRALFSTILMIIVVYISTGFQGLISSFFALLIAIVFIWYSLKQIGGLTGDVYGAVNEIGEVIILASFNILFK